MTAALFMTYITIYVAITYVIGFFWTCLDCRIEDGKLKNHHVNEALAVSLIAPVWVPIRIVVELLRLLRGILKAVFNDLF